MLKEEMRVFRIVRPKGKENYPELGYNAIVVVAKNKNQAKGIALDAITSLIDNFQGGVTKKDLVITDITDELQIGYVIAKE